MNKHFRDAVVALVIMAVVASVIMMFVAAQAENTQRRESGIVNQSVATNPALPRTLAGYKRAFANLPAERWGGGDISVTTVLRDGRAVWFFGDTLTKRGGHIWMPRNTSLVQTGGKLRAANDGTQIIPTTRDYVYWPVKVDEVRPGVLLVWTSKIRIGNGGMWDFERVRKNEARTALVTVNGAGDMKFQRWVGWTTNPTDKAASPADGSDVRIIGPGHWGYQRMVHYDLPLTGGRHLVTESQNWDNGNTNTLDYRPLLSSQ